MMSKDKTDFPQIQHQQAENWKKCTMKPGMSSLLNILDQKLTENAKTRRDQPTQTCKLPINSIVALDMGLPQQSKSQNQRIILDQRIMKPIEASLGQQSLHPQNDQGEFLKESLIDLLQELMEEDTASSDPILKSKNLLNQCIQQQSFEQDSDQGDKKSEIVDMTPEERILFSSFINPGPTVHQNFLSKCAGTGRRSDIQRIRGQMDSLPDNKRKVIRNFFRPKLVAKSMVKDNGTDKTCSNSQIMDEFSPRKSAKKTQLMNSNDFQLFIGGSSA